MSLLLFPCWGRERPFLAPSTIESVPERALVEPGAPAPLLHMQGLAARSQHAVVSFVRTLLQAGGPAGVLWGVISVYVDALKAVFGAGSAAHVHQKHVELFPRIANLNAPPTVPWVCSMGWLTASPVHVSPRCVLGATPAARCFSMPPRWLANPDLRVQASARLRISSPEISGAGLHAIPAVAQTAPHNMPQPSRIASDKCGSHDNQSTVALPGRRFSQPMCANLLHADQNSTTSHRFTTGASVNAG